jgi:hypothetical protein
MLLKEARIMQQAALRHLTSGRPVGLVEHEIRELERRYEMTSDTMRALVRSGKLDTSYTSRWLILLEACGR